MFDYFQKIYCFFVLSEILLQLKPSQKYEKYLKMTMGLICIGVVIMPIGKALNGGENATLPDSLAVFEKKLTQAFEEGSALAAEEIAGQAELYETGEGKLSNVQKEALKEQIQKKVMGMDYEVGDMNIEDGKLVITLKDVSGRIKVTVRNEEAEIKKIIAKELMADENAITVVIQ